MSNLDFLLDVIDLDEVSVRNEEDRIIVRGICAWNSLWRRRFVMDTV